VNPKEFGKAARDDLVDAAACAATALRIASGTARRFPKHVTRDAKGLDIAIWA
jgi:predicted RNase H-like nuclease